MSPTGGHMGDTHGAAQGAAPVNTAGADLRELASRRASFAQTAKAVGWSFFGVRKRSAYEQDVQKLNPVHVIVAGILGAALFVGVLIVMVRWIVGSGIAGG
jgi:hypothetical protein